MQRVINGLWIAYYWFLINVFSLLLRIDQRLAERFSEASGLKATLERYLADHPDDACLYAKSDPH